MSLGRKLHSQPPYSEPRKGGWKPWVGYGLGVLGKNLKSESQPPPPNQGSVMVGTEHLTPGYRERTQSGPKSRGSKSRRSGPKSRCSKTSPCRLDFRQNDCQLGFFLHLLHRALPLYMAANSSLRLPPRFLFLFGWFLSFSRFDWFPSRGVGDFGSPFGHGALPGESKTVGGRSTASCRRAVSLVQRLWTRLRGRSWAFRV